MSKKKIYIIAYDLHSFRTIIYKLCQNGIINEEEYSEPIYLHTRSNSLRGKSSETKVIQESSAYQNNKYDDLFECMDYLRIKPYILDLDNLNKEEVKNYLKSHD